MFRLDWPAAVPLGLLDLLVNLLTDREAGQLATKVEDSAKGHRLMHTSNRNVPGSSSREQAATQSYF
jgi:hypothetical protein